MAEKWIRKDVLVHEHPKFLECSGAALVVIDAAWRLARVHGFYDGEISRYWKTACLARFAGFDRWPDSLGGPSAALEIIKVGMDECLRVGAVQEVDGCVMIHGFADYQPDPTAAERSKRYRDRKSVTSRHVTDRDATLRDVARRRATGITHTETVLIGAERPAPLSTPKGPDCGFLGSVQPPAIPTNSETEDSHKHPLVSQEESPNPRIIDESPTPQVDSKRGNPNIIDESGDTTGANAEIIGESATSIIETGMIRAVFATYRNYHPRAHPKPRSTGKEWRAIKARLAEGYSVADLRKAIDGCHASPFHTGENERGRRYDSLELIMRDSSKVAQFMELLEQRDQPVLSTKIKTGIRATENWLESKRKELSREIT